MTCAIILAAGKSERMGTQKLLLPYAGSTMIARVVDAFVAAPVDLVCVVLRPASESIRRSLAGRSVMFVENPMDHGDMLSSVRCGIRALPDEAKTILVSPGDQPALEPALVRQMLEVFHGTDSKILVPVHQGRRGHPLVFRAEFRQEVLARFDDTGLRGLLQAHSPEVLKWDTPNPAVLQDLDTADDVERWEKR